MSQIPNKHLRVESDTKSLIQNSLEDNGVRLHAVLWRLGNNQREGIRLLPTYSQGNNNRDVSSAGRDLTPRECQSQKKT